jgi:phosphoglucomutase
MNLTLLVCKIAKADEFEYLDPVDGSISSHQGIRVLLVGGSRVVFRLSGTAGSGATIRIYLEKYESDPAKIFSPVADALGDMVEIALTVSDLAALTGMTAPTVIT